MEQDRLRFLAARTAAAQSLRGQNGIGTLGEKLLHLTLKYYYASDSDASEKRIGRYVADIFDKNGITEIQTRSLYRLCPKLEAFLPLAETRVVYPFATETTVCWLDPVSGQVTERRRSPKHTKPLEALSDLYPLRRYFRHPAFCATLFPVEVEQYRLLNGNGENRKRRATKHEVVPVAMGEPIDLRTSADYRQFLPPDLPDCFDRNDLARAGKISGECAGRVLQMLRELDILEQVGKRGRCYLYRKTEKTAKN